MARHARERGRGARLRAARPRRLSARCAAGVARAAYGAARRARGAGRAVRAVFHATSNDDKRWPTDHWSAVACEMRARGLHVLLPWGSEHEREEAQRIAARAPGAVVLPKLTLADVARKIDRATLVVGVDTGFVHMAHALEKPTVMIFRATSRQHLGVSGAPHSLSIGDEGAPPSVDDVLGAIERVYPMGIVEQPRRVAAM
ncbi:glycosyltransferase family 9 protein [Burkholderia thailandensis]|uniref:glycosyltransferase family 9 protein n=1 Tax=Burkholderia thailandensis TaxID=57975 RepID=UPI00385588BF